MPIKNGHIVIYLLLLAHISCSYLLCYPLQIMNLTNIVSLHQYIDIQYIVMDAMKMGNNVPRAGIEPTSLAFQATVLTITPHMLP